MSGHPDTPSTHSTRPTQRRLPPTQSPAVLALLRITAVRVLGDPGRSDPAELTPDSLTLTHPPSRARSAAEGAGAGPGRSRRARTGAGPCLPGAGIWAVLGRGSASVDPPEHLRVAPILSSVCPRPTEALASLGSLLLLLAAAVHKRVCQRVPKM